MKIVLIILFVLYLIYFFINRIRIAKNEKEAEQNAERATEEYKKVIQKHEERVREATKEYEKVTQEYNESTEELYNIVEKILGDNKLQELKKKEIWKEMPECLMYFMFGKPQNIEKNNQSGVIYKTWCYDAIPDARSNAKRKYKGLYYSQNGFITGWDTI